jgi:ADP-ribosylglycohydrolase
MQGAPSVPKKEKSGRSRDEHSYQSSPLHLLFSSPYLTLYLRMEDEGEVLLFADVKGDSNLGMAVAGFVYGQAIGDSVGLSTEFWTKDRVERMYGTLFSSRKYTHGDRKKTSHTEVWPLGSWTDDTDHLLLAMKAVFELNDPGFTAAEKFMRLLCSWVEEGMPMPSFLDDDGLWQSKRMGRPPHGVGATIAEVVKLWKLSRSNGGGGVYGPRGADQHGYMEYDGGRGGCGDGGAGGGAGGGFSVDAAHAYWSKFEGARKPAANGALMRVGPEVLAAVLRGYDDGKVMESIHDFCSVTHCDPRCVASSIVVGMFLCYAFRKCAGNKKPNVAVDIPLWILEARKCGYAYLEGYARLTGEPLETYTDEYTAVFEHDNFSTIMLDGSGAIGYTYKCLAAAITALKRISHDDPVIDVVCDLVACGGDADTNAAIAGKLIGAVLGSRDLVDAVRANEWHLLPGRDMFIDPVLRLVLV